MKYSILKKCTKKKMILRKILKKSAKFARKLRHKLFLRAKNPLFSITDFLLKFEWIKMATFLFRVYNFLDGRYKNHWIKAIEVFDINNCEIGINKIFLSDEIKIFSYGPTKINYRRCNKEPVIIPPVFASIFTNVIIHSNASAIYDPEKESIFLQRIIHPDEDKFLYHHKHLAILKGNNGILRFPNTFEKISRGIFLSGTGCFNYYHYLVEFISKTEYVPKLPEKYREYPLLVHQNAKKNVNFAEYLKLANRKFRKIIFLSEEKSYKVESLVQISHLSICPFNLRENEKLKASYFFTRPSTVKYLRNLVLPIALEKNKRKKYFERIFLSRKQQGRRTYNQQELVGIIKKHGFKEIYLEEYDIYEQAYLFNQANLIIGPTGAAWTNLLFAGHGANGLCWMSDKFGDLSVYSNIANIVGCELFSIIVPNKSIHSSYYLDPKKFEVSLEKLLKI